jgi:hypothetical protein
MSILDTNANNLYLREGFVNLINKAYTFSKAPAGWKKLVGVFVWRDAMEKSMDFRILS